MKNTKSINRTIKMFIINTLVITLVFIGFYYMRGNSQIATVGTTALNVREKPDAFSTVITQVHKEDKVTISDQKNNWYKIQTSDKTVGWVPDWLLFDGTSGPYTNLSALISKRNIELKKENSENSQTIKTLKKNEYVNATLELNGWVRIYSGGDYGWVPNDCLTIQKNRPNKYKDNQSLHIATTTAFLMNNNSTSSKKGNLLKYGDSLTYVSETENGWMKVKTKDGKTGFLNSWQVTSRKISGKEEKPGIPMPEFTIMLDPGHGGDDPGAQTTDGTTFEKDVTLKTALAVRKELQSHGFNVLMTHDTDKFVSLTDIGKISSSSQANAFISFHYDSSAQPNTASGTTTFYRKDGSKMLAQAINDSIANILPLDNRGFGKQDYQVLRENSKPAVLLELGYINNDFDASYITNKKYHQKIGEAVYDGLMHYIEEKSSKGAEN
ncbi:N-acetylmuramoyl-L-alanine amidase [Vagococcus luciliae]|uniref:SH3b domain-containing protein n=1 Tax=Vagococcus luciliae TaxID=2920380 RepID=A0ABY5NY00_9ENTE|nr:N-acetylmuramoyl-L-alanine amidase [Vagococcus luciliae]UUV98536.1 hypothetical protein G314FT_06890 [Vagococcus luciliae]